MGPSLDVFVSVQPLVRAETLRGRVGRCGRGRTNVTRTDRVGTDDPAIAVVPSPKDAVLVL